MFKKLTCKDMSRIEGDERNISLILKLRYHFHLFICGNCRNFISQMQLTRENIKKLILAKFKYSEEQVLKIEKETIEKFTKK